MITAIQTSTFEGAETYAVLYSVLVLHVNRSRQVDNYILVEGGIPSPTWIPYKAPLARLHSIPVAHTCVFYLFLLLLFCAVKENSKQLSYARFL